MDEGSLAEEIEVLEAIYIEELDVQKNDKNEVDKIVLQLHPATGEDLDQRFVCMTLILDLSPEYPNVPPDISIKNPRGIAEEELLSLREDMHKLCEDRKGGPVLFELIELAKDSLTAGNIPHCPCMICLEHFAEGEKFTKTECYHYFHEDCLSRYVTHVLTKTPEVVPRHAEPSPDTNKLVCPVCREEIHYKFDDFDTVADDKEFVFTPTDELRELQARMAAVFERQKANGGIIDVEAERNKYLVKNNDVVLLQLPMFENKQKSDRPRSGQLSNEKVEVEILKEFQSRDSDREVKGQGSSRGVRRPESEYMKDKVRGNKFNDCDAHRGRGRRWREERRNKPRNNYDTDEDSRGRKDIKDETYCNKEGSGAKRKHLKEVDRNYTNRNNKSSQSKGRREEIVSTSGTLKETVGNYSDSQTASSQKPDTAYSKDSEEVNVEVNQQAFEERKRAVQMKNDIGVREKQHTFGRNIKADKGGFGRPPEHRVDREGDNFNEAFGKSTQYFQKQRRGGFGRPGSNREEYRTDKRANKTRGGFRNSNKDFKETSEKMSSGESSSQEVERSGNEKNKKYEKENESIEGSATEIIDLEEVDIDRLVRDKQEGAGNRTTSDRNTNVKRGSFGRPSDGRVDKSEKSYDEVRSSAENVRKHKGGGFGKPEKKNYQDERYNEGKSRKNRGGFGKPNKDSRIRSEDIDRPSSGEITSRGDIKSDTYRPGKEDQSIDEGRHEKTTGDRYFRDNRNSGNWRREENRYSRDGKSYRDTGNRYDERDNYGDRRGRGYRQNRDRNSNNYHDTYDKQNRLKNEGRNSDYVKSRSEEIHQYNGYREKVSESVRKDSGFQRRGESEQNDRCTDRTVKKFDKMSISVGDRNLQQNDVNLSANKKSDVCDRESGDGKMNLFSAGNGESDDRCLKKEKPPGFSVSPPPGFHGTDSTSVVQPPPGFS